jgi:hypothetical protein
LAWKKILNDFSESDIALRNDLATTPAFPPKGTKLGVNYSEGNLALSAAIRDAMATGSGGASEVDRQRLWTWLINGASCRKA